MSMITKNTRRNRIFNFIKNEIEEESLLFQLCSFVFLGVAFSFLLLEFVFDDNPNVIFSAEGKCLKVENIRTEDHYSCDNLPQKYNFYYGSSGF